MAEYKPINILHRVLDEAKHNMLLSLLYTDLLCTAVR